MCRRCDAWPWTTLTRAVQVPDHSVDEPFRVVGFSLPSRTTTGHWPRAPLGHVLPASSGRRFQPLPKLGRRARQCPSSLLCFRLGWSGRNMITHVVVPVSAGERCGGEGEWLDRWDGKEIDRCRQADIT